MRIRRASIVAAVIVAVTTTFAAFDIAAAAAPCGKKDRECALKAAKSHPAHTAAFWKPTLAKPVSQRLGPAPAALVEYLQLDNIANGFPEEPRSSVLSPDFLADVRGAIDDLPASVRRVFSATFAGVWFIDDLGGTGFTDAFLDPAGKPAGAYIVLDAKVLGKFTANAWATWKENTPFKAADGWKLEARIEDAAGDNRRNAIQYILLHELGHVLATRGGIHPRWDLPPKDIPAGERYPFFDLSWRIDRTAGKYVSKFEDAIPLRPSIVYYLGAKLEAAQMAPVYASLEKTNLPTLYAATIPGDDFAESFASYVHTVLMKRPWEITIRKDGKVEKTLSICWEEPRCAEKRRILEEILQ